MNNHPADWEGEQEDGVDPGEPITVLAAFDQDASTGLVARVRRSIQRRTTTAQLMTFSWTAPMVVLREFWLILMAQTNTHSSGKEGDRGGKTS